MAVDAALLASRERGEARPTLRLYRWERPTVTLGRFQPVGGIDVAACRAEGIALARRPTGGRGVLHDDEVTYSVTASVEDGLPRGVAASYRHLCGALAEAYRRLGVAAGLTSRSRGDASSPACYLHATGADLSLGAAKLSGSAQTWSRETCLQHGSFVVSRDVAREARAFGLDTPAAERLSSGTATLSDALGRRPSPGDVCAAVKDAFEETLGVRFEPGDLTEAETRCAEERADEFRVEPVPTVERRSR